MKKILIVDDLDANRLVLKLYLSKEIFTDVEIEEAKNGLEAVNIAKENYFDFILMDLNMPVMDGGEATKIIKLNKPETVIIAVTAHDIYSFRQNYNYEDFNGHIKVSDLIQ